MRTLLVRFRVNAQLIPSRVIAQSQEMKGNLEMQLTAHEMV